jgi:TolB-like protein/Flp pilus assembly protein TadD/tRNA A-37 threonylcarbamoyl transferase component Bud32
MTPELFERAREVFGEASELSGSERDEYLGRACRDDPGLRTEVDALLAESTSPLEEDVRTLLAELASDADGAAIDEGTRIGAYELVREIGRGGMGTVYLARRADQVFRKDVAVKVLSASLDTEYFLKRFRAERQILASLTHPNIAMLLDGGTTGDGLPYFVMEYVDGVPIHQYCDERALATRERLQIFRTVCGAVQNAHGKLVVHRDLKPSNILVTSDGVPKLLDFGLAKLLDQVTAVEPAAPEETTGGHLRLLTPAYASPEQIRGEKITTASDVYSLGVLLYQLLSGRRPYRIETGEYGELAKAACEQEPARLDGLPEDLSRIVLKTMRKEPWGRYGSAGELGEDLGRFLEGRPVHARPGTAAYRARSFLRRNRAAVAAVAVAALSLALGLLGRVRTDPPPVRAPRSLAVLPFHSLAAERDAVLELGMADTLVTRLSTVPGISLRPLSSVRRQASESADAREAGRTLRVDAVVEGNLQRVGDRLRVSVRLVDVSDGHAIWSQAFDTVAADIFAVEDAIAERVAEALFPRLGAEERAKVVRRGTGDLAAYNAYLKGRYFWNRRTEADFRKAIVHFSQAIAADPDYALAHSGLADCYSLLSIWGAGPPRETLEQARAAAQRAVAARDAPGEAFASVAFVRWIYDWDWEGAEQAFRRAIALNPGYATARQWYAYYLASRSRFDEAVVQIRRAQELDPLSVSIATDVGEIHLWAGRHDEAAAHIRAALDMEPNFPMAHNVLGMVHLKTGRLADAIAELETASRLDASPRMLGTLGHAYGLAGRAPEARAIGERLDALSKSRYISPFQRALVHTGLGEDDRAFALLRRAYEERSDNMAILRVYPLLARLRRDRRFDELMRRVDAQARSS